LSVQDLHHALDDVRRAPVLAAHQSQLVASLETTRDRLLRLGGKVLMPEVPVPGFGKLAVVTDPFGVEFSLFEPRPMS
jgi:predicted enzyme related to lactoylglutathione lyase